MNDSHDGAGTRQLRRSTVRLAGLAATLVTLAVTLDLGTVHQPLPSPEVALAWTVLLAAAFFLVEVVPLHLEWAGQAYSLSLSEAPLVVGLLCFPVLPLVLARVIGGGLALAVHRKQPPQKLAFNVSSQLFEASIGLVVFLQLPHHTDSNPMIAASAVMVAVVVSSVVSTLSVCLAIRLSVGHLDLSVARSFARTGVAAIVVNSSLALVIVTALHDNRLVAAPLLVVLVAAGGVYRAYVMLRQRHASLEMLYQFTRGLGQTSGTDGRIRDILERTRDMLRAERAGLLLLAVEDGEQPTIRWVDVDGVLRTEPYVASAVDWPFAKVMSQGGALVIPRATRDAAMTAFLADRGFRDATIAPLRLDGQVRGALFVANRHGDVATFTSDDGKLFETVAAQVSSVLDNSRLLDRLTYDSLHDALTGLANRQCYQSRLRAALGAHEPRFAVLLTDLDRFKEVNDTLGHHHGDLLIREIACRIADTAPAIATVARLGGDEFALLVPGVGVEEAVELGKRVRAAIGQPCTLDGVSVDIEASVGIAVAPAHGIDDSVLLKRADMAMYAAKSSRSGCEVYDSQRDEYSPRRLALASRLRHAIADGELTLHFQPQVTADARRPVGVEALVRWNHPDYGLLLPAEFIPLAEQSGAIADLTAWVLKTGLRQLAAWRAEGLDLTLSINVSMRNLLDATVADTIGRLLRYHGLQPEWLTLEITESHIMSDPGRTLPVLHRLAAIGTRLSVDDFGTGYSSLSYLQQLPVHEVKIDKSFVHSAGDPSTPDGAIICAIVGLARSLGLDTVAEGVEDAGSAATVTQVGCTRLQGFHIGRPMAAPDLRRWALRQLHVPRQIDVSTTLRVV